MAYAVLIKDDCSSENAFSSCDMGQLQSEQRASTSHQRCVGETRRRLVSALPGGNIAISGLATAPMWLH